MLILGPYSSWILWNTERSTLIKQRQNAFQGTYQVNSNWIQQIRPTHSEILSTCKRTGMPIDVIVPHNNVRNIRGVAHLHYHKNPFPSGTLIPLSSTMFCLSPEYLFVRMCPMLSEIQRIYLGMSLCATFAIDANAALIHPGACSNLSQLKRFCLNTTSTRGIARARSILNFLTDNADSPREIELYLLMCLPQRKGGFGFIDGQCNIKLKSDLRIQRHTLTSERFADISWPIKRVSVEYESSEFHESNQAMQRDSLRRAEFARQGYRVFTVSNEQIKNLEKLRIVGLGVSKALKKRVYISQDFYQRQLKLHSELLKDITGQLLHP